jgi:murein DD-endopeptidase MepM/ murein hydrolase activator NlpD
VGLLASAQHRRPGRRLFAAALMASLGLLPLATPDARGQSSMTEVKDRLDALQSELDDAVARLEELRTRQDGLLVGVSEIEQRIRDLEADRAELQARVAAAATRLYMTSDTDTLEVLLSSESFADLAGRSQTLAHIGELDSDAFAELEQTQQELASLQAELSGKAEELTSAKGRLDSETATLQARFNEVASEYDRLKQKLAAERAAAFPNGAYISASGKACPIAAANSFIDSWGYPRSGGRTHEGTDMMAAMGAPVVAITDGRITFAGVGTTAGNWLILSGDDGNGYWYMHNRENLVTGGRVKAGEQIATVGDTGNALGGPPHVHFEFHPDGGGPVNPYPLLAGICRGAR